jgi:diacylglycerol kinase (ATP)
MSARVILNPYSGRWKARQRWPEAAAALQAAGIEFDMLEMSGPNDGIAKAREAAQAGFSPIIVAGGDGAIGEVVNGLYQANPDGVLGPLGVIPLGTANDLMVNLGLPLDLSQAAQVIAAGKTRRIDLIQANEWVFDNNSAVGLEPVVTQYNIRMVRLKGILRYLVAALRAIWAQPAWQGRMQWDDGHYEGPLSLVSVGNGAITGGIFRMSPAADPADGKLTFVYAYVPGRLRMLGLLPKTFNGSHVNDPAVHQHHATRLEIELSPSSPIQVDGELRSEAITRVVYQVLPGKLEILAR